MRLTFVLCLLVFASNAVAQRGGGGGGGRPSFDSLLATFDADSSGSLSVSEVPQRLWQRLGQADANQDGVVTRAEYNAYQGSPPAGGRGGRGGRR